MHRTVRARAPHPYGLLIAAVVTAIHVGSSVILASDIALKDGRILADATIVKYTGSTATIRYGGGFAQVPLTLLPDSVRKPLDRPLAEQSKETDRPKAETEETARKMTAKPVPPEPDVKAPGNAAEMSVSRTQKATTADYAARFSGSATSRVLEFSREIKGINHRDAIVVELSQISELEAMFKTFHEWDTLANTKKTETLHKEMTTIGSNTFAFERRASRSLINVDYYLFDEQDIRAFEALLAEVPAMLEECSEKTKAPSDPIKPTLAGIKE